MSQNIWAQAEVEKDFHSEVDAKTLNLKPNPNFSCLSRNQLEAIEGCFEKRDLLVREKDKQDASQTADLWLFTALGGVAGVIVGVIVRGAQK